MSVLTGQLREAAEENSKMVDFGTLSDGNWRPRRRRAGLRRCGIESPARARVRWAEFGASRARRFKAQIARPQSKKRRRSKIPRRAC